jgi:amino acid transporter
MFGIKLSSIFSLPFWFTLNPGPLNPNHLLYFLWILVGFLVVAIIFRALMFYRRKDLPLVNVWRKLSRLFLTMGLVGFVILFFFYEGVMILGARFWFLFWLIGIITWLVYILVYSIRKLPKIKKEITEKKKFEKYLPKRK